MKKKIKVVFVIFGTFALIAGGLLIARKLLTSSANSNATFTVKAETYKNVIDIAGNISASQEQNLFAAADSSVLNVYFEAGDSVKKGDIIIRLDDTEQQYNLAKLDYDIAQKQVTGSQRDVELAKQQRISLLQKLEDRRITANFDGVIADLTAQTGDYLLAKDEAGMIVDRSYLRATVEVVETDAPKLQAGQKVTFTFPSYTKGTVEGYVVSFPAVGKVTTRGATVVEAEIRIDNPPEEILPNYSFTGEIEISPPEHVLLVERLAIGYDNGKPYVMRVKDGGEEKISVTLEPYGRDYVNILSGLQEGDVVKQIQSGAVSGQNRRPGGMQGGRQGGGAPGGMPGGRQSGGMPGGAPPR